MFDGVSYGLLAGLTTCGLVLLLVFGTKIHGWYALSCACALAAFAGLNSLAPFAQFAQWPAAAPGVVDGLPAAVRAAIAAAGRFLARLDRVARATLVIFAIATLYAALETQRLWTLRMVQALAVASTVILAAGAVKVLRRQPWPAALFLAGAALLLGGLSTARMSAWIGPAWAPPQPNLVQAAVIAELVIFILALGMRLRGDGAGEARVQQKAETRAPTLSPAPPAAPASRAAPKNGCATAGLSR